MCNFKELFKIFQKLFELVFIIQDKKLFSNLFSIFFLGRAAVEAAFRNLSCQTTIKIIHAPCLVSNFFLKKIKKIKLFSKKPLFKHILSVFIFQVFLIKTLILINTLKKYECY